MATMPEYLNVEKYVAEILNYEHVIEATRELITVINQDTEENLPIKEIKSLRNKYGTGWTVWAIMDNGNPYKYAMYITEDGQIIADGF